MTELLQFKLESIWEKSKIKLILNINNNFYDTLLLFR